MPEIPSGLLTVLVASVPGPIHFPVREDPKEVAAVAAVQEFGFLVVPGGQVELFGQGGEGGDLPLSHRSASPGGQAARDAAAGGRSGGTGCVAHAAAAGLLKAGREPGGPRPVPGLAVGQVIQSTDGDTVPQPKGDAPWRGRWGGIVSSLAVASW